MIERIVVVGFPRSGTNYLTRLLAHYFDGPGKPSWDGDGIHHLVRKIHWEYQLHDGAGGLADIAPDKSKIVHIIRDPRDVTVSAWFYYRNLTNEDPTFNEFLRGPFAKGFSLWPCGWREHTERWDARDDTINVYYEQLRSSCPLTLIGLGIQISGFFDLDWVRYAVELSQGKMRRSYCSDNLVSAGVSEWREIFDADSIAFLKEYAGGIMDRLGYQ